MGVDGELAFASAETLDILGILDRVGSIRSVADGKVWGVTGPIVTPESMRALEPALCLPGAEDSWSEPVSLLIVIASNASVLNAVGESVSSLLALDDPSKATLETSSDVASLRSLVDSQLSLFGRGLTIGVLALSGTLTAAILFVSVNQRRKDFGRRRALGASQRLIVLLLIYQTTFLALLGAIFGLSVGVVILVCSGDPLPAGRYLTGLGLLAVTVAVVASLLPALFAARREPIVELRVP